MISIQTAALLQETLTKMMRGIVETVPNLILSLVILLAGYILAKILKRITIKVLKGLQIDKLAKSLNQIDIVNKTKVEIQLSSIFGSIVYYLIMLMVLIMSSTALGIDQITNLMSSILAFLPDLFVAFFVLILGTLLADIVKNSVFTALKSLGVPSASMISAVLFYFLFINVVMIALKQASVKTDFLAQNISIIIAGFMGAFAIGYGLASKDIMANILASFSAKKEFRVGDIISIDGIKGKITSISKSNLLLENEESQIRIPLSKAIKETIIFHNS